MDNWYDDIWIAKTNLHIVHNVISSSSHNSVWGFRDNAVICIEHYFDKDTNDVAYIHIALHCGTLV